MVHKIENIITTKEDLYEAVSSKVSKVNPAIKEVMFYREALYVGFQKIKQRDLLSINDIIDIQKLLIQNYAGIRATLGTALVKMAVLHYQFETIHPFYDGNGRTGRIVNILYLILKGYLDIPILYLSSYIIRNKTKYYELLLSVSKDSNWEDWILYVLIGIEQTAKETIVKIKKSVNYLIRQ